MARFSTFMVALVIVSLLVGLFTLFLSGLNGSYTRNDYSSSELEVYNKLTELSKNATGVSDKVNRIAEKQGIFDVIGGFFSLGWESLKNIFSSMSIFDTMLNAGLDDADLGESGNLLKTSIASIILILLFIGVVISAIIKWQV